MINPVNIAFYFTAQISPSSGGVEKVASIMHAGLSRCGYRIFSFYLQGLTIDDVPVEDTVALPEPEGDSEVNRNFLVDFIKKHDIRLMVDLASVFNRSSRCALESCSDTCIPHVAVYHNVLDMPLRANRRLAPLMENAVAVGCLRTLLGIVQRMPFYKGGNYIYRNSSDCVLLARSYVRDYHKLISRDPERKLAVIYNPLPAFNIPADVLSHKKKTALFVGRLERQKGLDVLLRAWSLSGLAGWNLKIVGDGSQAEYLRQLADELGISDSVSFEGHGNPTSYYEEATLFCMTSVYEGFPMTLIECQAFGCVPIITDSYTAASEIVEDGVNGYLVKGRNPESYAEALRNAVANPDKLAGLAGCCIRNSAKFESNRIVMEWKKLLDRRLMIDE